MPNAAHERHYALRSTQYKVGGMMPVKSVLEAIRDGQAELAATRMREHLTGVRTVVEQRLRA